MMWDNEIDKTVIVTEGNAYALARELAKYDMEYEPPDFIPFLKERIGYEYEIRILFDEAFHWGIQQRIKQTMKEQLEKDYIQLTVDEDGDFEFLRLGREGYLAAAEERRKNAESCAAKGGAEAGLEKTAGNELNIEMQNDGTLRCELHKKYKGVRLTERAAGCPGCTAVYWWKQQEHTE